MYIVYCITIGLNDINLTILYWFFIYEFIKKSSLKTKTIILESDIKDILLSQLLYFKTLTNSLEKLTNIEMLIYTSMHTQTSSTKKTL